MTRYHPIDTDLFIDNRKKLCQQIKPNSLVVLNANDIMPTNADGVMKFFQNSDIFYLTGIDQEDIKLVIYPDAPKKEWQEILFIGNVDEETTQWEGQKHTLETASAASGITNVCRLDDFDRIFRNLMEQVDYVYLNTNEHVRANNPVETRDARFIAWCRQRYPLHTYQRLAPIMHSLRMIKSPVEIELIRQACHITERGFRRILPFIRPGVAEYAIEAELAHEFINSRADGFAYDPIIATGANACILHYQKNNQTCKAGETILLDVAARYAHYCSDMTRVVPVSGRFTSRQRAIYAAVLRVMRQAKDLLLSTRDFSTLYQEVGLVMEKELVDLGLLTMRDIKDQDPRKPAYKKYFMHGVSHHIGVDLHDVANAYSPFQPGMVLTLEPGIYIPEEGIGMRLENNVVIHQAYIEDLMASIPLEIEEIETLMQP